MKFLLGLMVLAAPLSVSAHHKNNQPHSNYSCAHLGFQQEAYALKWQENNTYLLTGFDSQHELGLQEDIYWANQDALAHFSLHNGIPSLYVGTSLFSCSEQE